MSSLISDQEPTSTVDKGKVDELLQMAQTAVSRGDLPSVQLALAHNGELVAFETFGEIRTRGEEKAATNDTLYVAFSTTKAVVLPLIRKQPF